MISPRLRTFLELSVTIIAGLAVATAVHRWRFRLSALGGRWAETAFARRVPKYLLALMIAAYVAVFGTLSLVKHINFHTHNDLAIHAQVIWNTSQGRWFETTLLEDRPTNYLGHHFSPALIVLTPLYLLWPDASLLLIVQSIVLALGVIPIYLYSRKQSGGELVALSLAAAYLLFPALEYVNLFDFHEIVLGVPLLSFAAYCLLTERYRPFFVFLGLCLMVKEEMAFIGMGFALYILLVQKRYRMGAILLAVVICWALLLMGVVMPAIAGDGYFPTGRYDYLGNTFGEMAQTLLLRPLVVLNHLANSTKLEFLLQLLIPVALLPLLGLDTLILAIPTLGYLLLSDYEPQYSIHYHYSAPLIPLLFMAAATGARRVLRWRGRSMAVSISALILVTGVSSYLLQGPGPLARHFNESGDYVPWPHLSSGYAALAAIPPDAAVMTLEEFAPHLAARQAIYIENEHYLPVEYVLQETTARTATPRYPAFVPPGRELVYPYFETVFDQDGYWLRRYQQSVPISNEVGVSFDGELTLLAYQWRDQSEASTPTPEAGQYLDLIVAWQAERQPTHRYKFFVHVLDEGSHRWQQVDQEVERGVYATTTWEPEMVVADHYRISLPWGTPPGRYSILIGAYDMDTGRRLKPASAEAVSRDDALILGDIEVTKPSSAPPADAVSPQHRLEVKLGSELELAGFDLPDVTVRQGETVPLILVWQSLADVKEDYLVSLRLEQIGGSAEQHWSDEPTGGVYPTSRWGPNEIVRDWHDLDLARDLPAGTYRLLLRLLDQAGRPSGPEIELASVTVEGRERVFTVPLIQNRMDARLGDDIAFLGYDLKSAIVSPGESVRLTLYWRALSEPSESYTVFTHLLDANERIHGQRDSTPGNGSLPTTSWVAGEVISDEYAIVVDAGTPPGEYVLEIGMYDATTGQRLPTYDGKGSLQGDRILLETVRVRPVE